jgi:peptide/nickel transport system permease protein
MILLLVRRVITAIPTILLVTLGVFFLLSLVPGDPAVTIASAGGQATPEQVTQVREEFHLQDSTLEQYGRWLGSLAQLDFGHSFVTGNSVAGEIADRFPVTFELAVAGIVVALLIGLPLGLYSGMRPNGAVDRFSRIYTSLGLAVPSFFLAIMLVVLVSVQWELLPPSGYVPITENPAEWLKLTLLPAITLGVGVSAVFSRQLRASLVDVLGSKYVQAAWARGGSPRLVVGKHALKNAANAPITILGLQFGYLIGGTVIIEQIFGIPGLGAFMLTGIVSLDLPVVQGCVFVFVLTQIAMSLIVDLVYGYLNPKVRVS